MIAAIEERAHRILVQSPGAVVNYRLRRDVLRQAPDAHELHDARKKLQTSATIQAVRAAQWADGSWGAFHSKATKRKQPIPTTEIGVERALALGLDASHGVLEQAAAYIVDVMEGRRSFPDHQERNDRWQTGMRLFLAATLARMQPANPLLATDRALWHTIAQRTFQSGTYRAEDEIAAHRELTGATVKESYLVLNGRYQLTLLGSQPGLLSTKLENALLQWLWARPAGIGYLGIPLSEPPPDQPGEVDRWLASLELLARSFPGWVQVAQPAIDWLWAQQNAARLWDFGPRPASIANLPLSDSWRRKDQRVFDWSTRVLTLLRSYSDPVASAVQSVCKETLNEH
ncbi:MAG TPA: hypothetical protein P5121_12385 [Caldilineaceae bacterium]|nr:hypothetical protein [Caldilineaceae bacterium]